MQQYNTGNPLDLRVYVVEVHLMQELIRIFATGIFVTAIPRVVLRPVDDKDAFQMSKCSPRVKLMCAQCSSVNHQQLLAFLSGSHPRESFF